MGDYTFVAYALFGCAAFFTAILIGAAIYMKVRDTRKREAELLAKHAAKMEAGYGLGHNNKPEPDIGDPFPDYDDECHSFS